eukprot:3600896-Pyramimonas_sp.AAC.1
MAPKLLPIIRRLSNSRSEQAGCGLPNVVSAETNCAAPTPGWLAWGSAKDRVALLLPEVARLSQLRPGRELLFCQVPFWVVVLS